MKRKCKILNISVYVVYRQDIICVFFFLIIIMFQEEIIYDYNDLKFNFYDMLEYIEICEILFYIINMEFILVIF